MAANYDRLREKSAVCDSSIERRWPEILQLAIASSPFQISDWGRLSAQKQCHSKMHPNRKEQTGRSKASSKRKTYLQAQRSRASPFACFPVLHNLEVLSSSSQQKLLRPTLLLTYSREEMGKGGSRTCGC